MPVMDEFRQEREALKHGTLKQKFSYFMDYYKWYVIIGAIALFMVISFIVQQVNKKDAALYVCILNAADLDGESYTAGFAEFAGIDTQEFDLIFDSSMSIRAGQLDQESINSTQRLMVYIAAAELDVIVSDAETMANYSNAQYFFDLREFLTAEQAKRLEPYFYYVDMKAVLEREEAVANLDESYVPYYPDPRKPEEMEQPIPVGIFLDECDSFKSCYYFFGEDVVLGVFQNSKRPETALQFIDYLMTEL